MQGFLLGLANGTVCLGYCAPVLVPFLLGAAKSIRGNCLALCRFLMGRLAGYLLFGILAWFTHRLVLNNAAVRSLALGAVYVTLALLLVGFGISKQKAVCAIKPLRDRLSWIQTAGPSVLPLALGFLTGLNLCPPFLLAFTGAADTSSLGRSLLFFFMFFLGTSVYLMPMPFLGSFRRMAALETIGKLSAFVVAAYYLYSGVVTFAGGLIVL